jgi:NAD(P)-dependent dehydrogenase (short-subunit alcohol dehydrogenase family)
MAAYDASKAGVEQFANSLRLEVKHEGVDVGVAHMSWIDTPLVRDAKEESSVFGRMIDSLPGPLSRTTSVEACGKAFVDAIAARRRTVFVPGWVGAIKRARNLVNSPAAERSTLKSAPELLPLMDEEVRRTGRSASLRTQAMDD